MRPILLTTIAGCLCAAMAPGAQFPPAAGTGERARTIHVDGRNPAASDDNPGIEQAPVRSVGEAARRAMANRRAGRATRIAIHPGIYRESVALEAPASANPQPTIVIEGVGGADVVLSGSDRWSGWMGDAGSGLYRHPMPGSRGFAELPEGWDEVREEIDPVILRGEAVFVDGRLYRQVTSRAALEARPERFYVDESGGTASASLWLHVAPGVHPNAATVEVAVRPSVVDLRGVGQVVMRNLDIRHAASRLQDPAVRLEGAANLVVQDVRIEWNNWNGIGLFDVRDVTLRRVRVNHNGAGGLNVWKASDLRVEDFDASYNNWRGAWGGFLGWATGQKLFHVHRARFLRYRAVGNQATGLWFDTDAEDVLIDRAYIADNAERGLFIEAIQGPFTLRNSTIRDNGEIGIFSTSAANVTLEDNVIVDNREHQILLPWQADHHVVRTITDTRTGRSLDIRSSGWTLTRNTIGSHGDALLFSVGMWPHFLRTLRASGNRWFRAAGPEGFGVYSMSHAPVGRMTLVEWQRLTRQDLDSTFTRRPAAGTLDD